jgi:hypothetical protein
MSEQEKPYMKETHSHIPSEWLTSDGQPVSGLSVAQQKRLELITKMTQDKDPVEYMRIFSAFTLYVLVMSTLHVAVRFSVVSLLAIVLTIFYFLFVRKRLATDTVRLMQIANDFDKYLWEGFRLKEMRQSAVKLSVFVFFPLTMVFLADLVVPIPGHAPSWLFYVVSIIISTIVWWVFFNEDTENLERLESDLNALQYL